MKSNSIKWITLLILTVIANSIAYSQPSRSDSVTISRHAQAQCVKCFQKQALKDSIILNKEVQIQKLEAFIDHACDSVINVLDQELSNCSNDLEMSEDKKKKWRLFGFGVSGLAVLEGVYIWIRSSLK